jgi:nucleoside-diphosphate-sugar epimerase
MPVIVVGADTPLGTVIVDHLLAPDREIRAFVTDPAAGSELRRRGVKVALGDLSDSSHVEGACLACFSAVLVMAAATDGRELAFASTAQGVLEGWAGAVRSTVRRVLWVGDAVPPATDVAETALVRVGGRDLSDVAREVAALDDAAEI